MKAVKKKLWTGWIRIQKIGLVIIFKKQLNELVTKIFEKITNESSGI